MTSPQPTSPYLPVPTFVPPERSSHEGRPPRGARMMHMLDKLAVVGLQARGVKRRKVPTKLGSVHILDAKGSGTLPPVVLLHGLSSQGADYAPLLNRLRRHCRRVLAPDMFGHGGTPLPRRPVHPAEMTEALTDALGAVVQEPVVLVGNSLGGMASIRVAGHAPHMVRGLVLVCPGGAPMDARALAYFMRTFDVPDRAASDAFVDRFAARKPKNKALMSWGVRVRFARRDVRSLIDSVTPDTLLTPNEVSSLPMPTLCLWGPQDQVLLPAHRMFFRDNLPSHAVFEEPEGYGHAPFMDRPAHLTRRIRAFLDQLTTSGVWSAA